MRKIAMWCYATIPLLLIAAASLVTFVYPDVGVRPLFIMAFLFICPGMVVVRSLRLDHTLIELSLILTLSIAIDAFIAGAILYAHLWSPIRIFVLLVVFCLLGLLLQLTAPYLRVLLQRIHNIFDLNAA